MSFPQYSSAIRKSSNKMAYIDIFWESRGPVYIWVAYYIHFDMYILMRDRF